MRVFDRVVEQVRLLGLPLVAVSLTAIPRANTPVLLMVHWHGFARPHATRSGKPVRYAKPQWVFQTRHCNSATLGWKWNIWTTPCRR